MHFKFFFFIYLTLSMDIAIMQESGYEYRRSGVHNGNLVRTVFGNYGVVAQPKNKGPRGAWIHDNNGYIGDVSVMVGAEVTALDVAGVSRTFHSVVVCPVDRPPDDKKEKSPNTGQLSRQQLTRPTTTHGRSDGP